MTVTINIEAEAVRIIASITSVKCYDPPSQRYDPSSAMGQEINTINTVPIRETRAGLFTWQLLIPRPEMRPVGTIIILTLGILRIRKE
ncbi:hypothetical protein AVEN_167415-1 [Araneus ventricosus]|uniref:Uncharacterized protein n=1 Tax=Araneus ventricosus TaxID=182803 RepID=A0A4Y2TU84_ARAVE|nr:hypothetical protein AVEN_167415-1 [Araneus ventricosus]